MSHSVLTRYVCTRSSQLLLFWITKKTENPHLFLRVFLNYLDKQVQIYVKKLEITICHFYFSYSLVDSRISETGYELGL